jgi:inward rectifier potassium channel
MAKPIKDPGLGSNFEPGSKRLMNKDGTFNVRKEGAPSNIRDTYQYLIKITWAKFFVFTFIFIVSLNILFALTYLAIGVEDLEGNQRGDFLQNFAEAFFFSFQTFTTVGYGHISPIGKLANIVAAIESATGLMVFAIITGLLYGRFSRPSMRLLYSNKALIAPYQDGWALMFRAVNLRNSTLLETAANVALTINTTENGLIKRNYFRLELEISKIEFFASTWTLVHAIDDKSPFSTMDLTKLANEDLEIVIQIKAFDDTFAQHVHSRNSYQANEIVVGAKFRPATYVDEVGDVVIPLENFNDYDPVPYL